MFKPCKAKIFSLQINLSWWYLRAVAVLILFCNMVTLRSSVKLSLSWKYFATSLLSGLFLVSWWCLEKCTKSCSPVCPIYKTLCLEHCAVLIISLSLQFLVPFIFPVMFNLSLVISLAFSTRYYVGMKLLICNIIFQNVVFQNRWDSAKLWMPCTD